MIRNEPMEEEISELQQEDPLVADNSSSDNSLEGIHCNSNSSNEAAIGTESKEESLHVIENYASETLSSNVMKVEKDFAEASDSLGLNIVVLVNETEPLIESLVDENYTDFQCEGKLGSTLKAEDQEEDLTEFVNLKLEFVDYQQYSISEDNSKNEQDIDCWEEAAENEAYDKVLEEAHANEEEDSFDQEFFFSDAHPFQKGKPITAFEFSDNFDTDFINQILDRCEVQVDLLTQQGDEDMQDNEEEEEEEMEAEESVHGAHSSSDEGDYDVTLAEKEKHGGGGYNTPHTAGLRISAETENACTQLVGKVEEDCWWQQETATFGSNFLENERFLQQKIPEVAATGEQKKDMRHAYPLESHEKQDSMLDSLAKKKPCATSTGCSNSQDDNKADDKECGPEGEVDVEFSIDFSFLDDEGEDEEEEPDMDMSNHNNIRMARLDIYTNPLGLMMDKRNCFLPEIVLDHDVNENFLQFRTSCAFFPGNNNNSLVSSLYPSEMIPNETGSMIIYDDIDDDLYDDMSPLESYNNFYRERRLEALPEEDETEEDEEEEEEEEEEKEDENYADEEDANEDENIEDTENIETNSSTDTKQHLGVETDPDQEHFSEGDIFFDTVESVEETSSADQPNSRSAEFLADSPQDIIMVESDQVSTVDEEDVFDHSADEGNSSGGVSSEDEMSIISVVEARPRFSFTSLTDSGHSEV